MVYQVIALPPDTELPHSYQLPESDGTQTAEQADYQSNQDHVDMF